MSKIRDKKVAINTHKVKQDNQVLVDMVKSDQFIDQYTNSLIFIAEYLARSEREDHFQKKSLQGIIKKDNEEK